MLIFILYNIKKTKEGTVWTVTRCYDVADLQYFKSEYVDI